MHFLSFSYYFGHYAQSSTHLPHYNTVESSWFKVNPSLLSLKAIRPSSIHLATLATTVIKTTCKSHTPADVTCRRATRTRKGDTLRLRSRGGPSLPPRDFCLESQRTSWTSGTRLTELIISQEAGCGFARNVPKFLTLIKDPVHSRRARNFRRSRSRTAVVYWCCQQPGACSGF